jgi:hypothetical protein
LKRAFLWVLPLGDYIFMCNVLVVVFASEMCRTRSEQSLVERECSSERSSSRSDEGTSENSVVTHEATSCDKDIQQKRKKKKGRHFDREIRAAQLEVELIALLATITCAIFLLFISIASLHKSVRILDQTQCQLISNIMNN